jgi:hypothetical protein
MPAQTSAADADDQLVAKIMLRTLACAAPLSQGHGIQPEIGRGSIATRFSGDVK